MSSAPITLLHGFTGSGAGWVELAALLPGHTFFAPDLRGHGANPTDAREPHTMDACTADLVAAWDERGIDRTHLVGYSMGGRLAVHIAAFHPERLVSLTLISAHAGLEDPAVREQRRRQDEGLAHAIDRRGIEWFAADWGARPMFAGIQRRGPEYVAAVRASRLANRPAGLAASLRGMGQGAAPAVWDRLPAIGCPALFIAGELDGAYPALAVRMAAAVPEGRAVKVPGAGHAVHQEDPQAVAAEIRAHLSSL